MDIDDTLKDLKKKSTEFKGREEEALKNIEKCTSHDQDDMLGELDEMAKVADQASDIQKRIKKHLRDKKDALKNLNKAIMERVQLYEAIKGFQKDIEDELE